MDFIHLGAPVADYAELPLNTEKGHFNLQNHPSGIFH